MNCIIIDDEAAARAIIENLCSKVDTLNVVAEFPNAIEAIKYLNKNEADLVFLDIHMPDFTGFDFIETLKTPPGIIITTSDRNFAIDAFEYDCIIDFLIKPISMQRFLKAVQKTQNLVGLNIANNEEVLAESDLYVNIDRRLIKIDMSSIYLIEANGDYINVKTEDRDYTIHSTLQKIVKKLPDSLFLKVHRSFVINVKKIVDIEDNSVLINKHVIPVSRAKRPELMKRLNLL